MLLIKLIIMSNENRLQFVDLSLFDENDEQV